MRKGFFQGTHFKRFRKMILQIDCCMFIAIAIALAISVDIISGNKGIGVSSQDMNEFFVMPFLIMAVLVAVSNHLKKGPRIHNIASCWPLLVTAGVYILAASLDMYIAKWYFSDLGVISFGLTFILGYLVNLPIAIGAALLVTGLRKKEEVRGKKSEKAG